MNARCLAVLILAVGLFVGCGEVDRSSPEANKLNFVFLLVDDLGWRDLGCFGSTFYETPNIDSLANQGMRFTEAYAACPVCSPTRASILTGKYPARVKLTSWIPDSRTGRLLPAEFLHEMPLEEVTLAEAFKEAGYATGFVGKWHLGNRPYYPEDQGFDVNVAGSQYGYPFTYFSPYKRGDNSMELEGGEEGEYLTDRLTDESLKFLESNKDKPFLLYHSYYTVHNPQEAKPELVDKYRIKSQGLPPHSDPRYIRDGDRETRQAQDDPVYAGMVQSLDESVGRILRKLEEMGVADHTAVIFMSDNGGLSTSEGSPTSNVPLRGGKGWLYEGGVREPMIVHWPGTVKGGSVCSEPVISNDFYPTMLEMAGISARPAQHVDGVSLVPLLQQEDDLPERPLFWHFPHYGNQGGLPGAAVRLGDFKLIEFFEEGSLELYNLREDISEENNLVQAMPDKVEELLELLHDWQESVDARMPSPNPDFDSDAWEAFHRRQRENSRR